MKDNNSYGSPAIGGPLDVPIDEHWSNFDSSVNALSFGFVATAILISMFLVMAIFERLLRAPSQALSPNGGRRRHRESQMDYNGKVSHSSPETTVYANGVSVVMPGDEIPTFIAHPAPVPCSPERNSWPSHQHDSLCYLSSSNYMNPACMRNQHLA